MKSRIALALTAFAIWLTLWPGISLAGPAVIVNKQNPISSISAKELSNIFKQKQKTWGDGGIIEVINLPKDSPLSEKFTEKVLGMSPVDLEKHYLKNALSGKGQPPKTAQSPAEVKGAVSGNKNAIGYIDIKDADPSVKVLPVDGKQEID